MVLDIIFKFIMQFDWKTSQLVSCGVLAWNLSGKILKTYGLVSI